MKRILDLVTTSLALPVLSPMAIVITLLVVSNLGLPLLFKQLSPGLNGSTL